LYVILQNLTPNGFLFCGFFSFFPFSFPFADGSGMELSYNYMNVLYTEDYIRIGSAFTPEPAFVEEAEQVTEDRQRFLSNIDTAMGYQVLCKGIYWYKKYPPITIGRNFTSIAFPYHGLYKTRSNLKPDGLFMSLQNPRRGRGHESNDGNKLMLEAYGRYMIVANPGEEGYTKSSWSQSTVNVDGNSQSKTSLPPVGVYSDPMDGRWYSSPTFDFAESTYRYPYGTVTTVQVCLDMSHLQCAWHDLTSFFLQSLAPPRLLASASAHLCEGGEPLDCRGHDDRASHRAALV
jgi:hypothetical protein